MKVLLWEYASGGAMKELDTDILAEGYGMLYSLVKSISGKHEVVVPVDKRLNFHSSLKIDPENENYIEVLEEEVENVDSALIIAPESNFELYNIVKILENNSNLLNSKSNFIYDNTDKSIMYKKLKNVNIPETVIVKNKEITLDPPFIVKPLDGVSCAGVSLVRDEGDYMPALKKVREESNFEKFIVQEYIEGVHLSVSMIFGEDVYPISLNRQLIDLNDFKYLGGELPVDHKFKKEIFEEAIKAVECFKGANGYVGVDIVYSDVPYVIEINPRITTPIIGLCEILDDMGDFIAKNTVYGPIKFKCRVRFKKSRDATIAPLKDSIGIKVEKI
ncbi:MAG: ATP-grasp domain-containing protein [Candidatus Hydrothermarchaeota archaeon]